MTKQPKIIPSSEYPTTIASDGTTYLVLTQGIVNFNRYGDYNFVASIVDADGSLLTPSGVWVSDQIGETASVTAGAGQYLVIIRGRFGAFAVRVSASGEVLDTKPFLIASPPIGTRDPAAIQAAWDGKAYFLEWSTSVDSAAYAYFGENGQVETTGTIAQNQYAAATAARNGLSLIVWSNADGVFVRSVARTGISDPIQLTTHGNIGVNVFAGADGFLAIWSVNGIEVVQPLDSAGRPIAAPIPLPTAAPIPLPIANPALLSWDGTSYVVPWSDQNGVHALRVTQTGVVGDAVDIAGPGVSSAGAASAGGRTEMLLNEKNSATLKSIDTANRVSPPAASPGNYPFEGIPPQFNVHAAFNEIDYVVTWADYDGIRLSRIATDGRRLDGDGIKVAEGSLLDVVSGSGITLLLWNDPQLGNRLRAARIDPSGVILDVPALTLSTTGTSKARALWDGSQFIVFWTEKATMAARIRPDGTILDNPPRQVFPGVNFEVAKSKDRYQLAYAGVGGVNVVNVSSELQLATASHLLSLSTERVKSFSITSNGDDFLIVWNNEAEEIAGQWANWDAQPIGPRVVYSNSDNQKGSPKATFDGTEFIVAWPEVTGASSLAFNMRRINRDAAEDVGPLMPLAAGPLIASSRIALLTDWSYVSAPVPAVVYGRSDRVDRLFWYERLFLQQAFSDRRRSVNH